MKKYVSIIVLVIISQSVFSQQKQWSLEDCINHAYENNIQLKQQTLQTQVLEANLKQAKMDRLPNLNASSSASRNYGRSINFADNSYINQQTTNINYGINSSVNLFNGFRKRNNIKKRQIDLQAQLENLEKAKEDLVLNITSFYLQVLFSLDRLKIAKEQADLTQQQIKRTKTLIDAGTLPKGNLLELKSQAAEEEVQIVEAENQLTLSYLDLAQLLDIENFEDFQIKEPQLSVDNLARSLSSAQKVYTYALVNRPEIKALNYNIKSSELDLDISKGNRFPVLDLQGGWRSGYADNFTDALGNKLSFSDQFKNNENKFFGLNLSIPIFNRWQVNQGIELAKINIEDARLNLENQKNILRKQIQEVYTNAQAALRKYYSSQTAVESSEEAFRYADEKYKLGLVDAFDYYQAKNQLTTAKFNLNQAKYEYIFRTKILDFYNGIPIRL